jgi:hypothetical protein
MVSAVKKAMTMLMPMLARAFMPGDLVDARHCASVFRNPVASPDRIQSSSYSYF